VGRQKERDLYEDLDVGGKKMSRVGVTIRQDFDCILGLLTT
jgi:hypothetical protein